MVRSLWTLSVSFHSKFPNLSCRKQMAQSAGTSAEKKLIQIDVSSDTVCPWCFVGKMNMDKAISSLKDRFNFEVRWHPFFLDPSAPKQGVKKSDFYRQKFGNQSEQIMSRMALIFQDYGLEYDTSGLTGNTMDSHRLIQFAGSQGFDKQNALVEELFLNYFTQGKFIGNREVLAEAAKKVGIEGAAEFLEDPNNGVKEVEDELKKYSATIRGVPFYMINGKHKLNGAQPSEVFENAFQAIANEDK